MTARYEHVRRSVSLAIVTAFLALAPTLSAAQLSLGQQTASRSLLEKAWDELFRDPRRSLRIFESELPKWAAFSKFSTGYVDADRGSLIAAIVAGDDKSARASWTRIQHETQNDVAQSERLGDGDAWRGNWAAAFRAYRKSGNFGATDCTLRTNRGLSEAASGHLQRAIEIWAAPPSCVGPNDLTDVHLALTGDAFAAQRKWSAARSMWIRGARERRNEPQIDMLYRGNVMALSMLYRYRRRFSPPS